MAITRLDTAASGSADGGSYSVSAGSNRCLVIGMQHEGNLTGSTDLVTATWGGQAMSKVHTDFLESGGTFDQEAYFFILLEAGIQAASGTTITFTNEITQFTWHAISYEGVNQLGGSSTIPETNEASTTISTPNPLTTADISGGAGSAVIALAGNGGQTSATWGGTNACTEQTDQQHSVQTTGSMADRLCSVAENVDVECTWASQNRAMVISMEIAPTSSVAPLAYQHLMRMRRN